MLAGWLRTATVSHCPRRAPGLLEEWMGQLAEHGLSALAGSQSVACHMQMQCHCHSYVKSITLLWTGSTDIRAVAGLVTFVPTCTGAAKDGLAAPLWLAGQPAAKRSLYHALIR